MVWIFKKNVSRFFLDITFIALKRKTQNTLLILVVVDIFQSKEFILESQT